ncbi:MAG: phospholipid carrier-dependent glycosyltransferase [Pseudonocardiales bacterium]|nr:phospholipid carrier-dependent glycosyltransferase [Pseudonocardiales bacterium]
MIDSAPLASEPGGLRFAPVYAWARTARAFPIGVVVAFWTVFQNFWNLSRPSSLVDEVGYARSGAWYMHHGMPSSVFGGRLPAILNLEHPPLAKLMFGLAQIVFGSASITSDRIVAATCTVAAAAIAAVWIARIAGPWTGLLAGALIGLLPMSVTPQLVRFGRDGMLDPVACAFVVAYLAILWEWWRQPARTRRAWVLAALGGAAVGLATASKENGFLAAVVPIVLVVAVARGAAAVRALQALTAVVVAGAVFMASYLPLGDPISGIRYLVHFQTRHSAAGHIVFVDGHYTLHQPWWANFWFAEQGLGAPATVAVLGTAIAAVVLRRDQIVAWCLAALVGPVVFHCVLASVTLPFYWAMWMPPLLVLSALGVVELVRRASAASWPGVVRLGSVAAAVAAAVLFAVAGVGQTGTVATLRREGPDAVPAVRATLHLSGTVLIAGLTSLAVSDYVPSAQGRIPASLAEVDTIVLGRGRPACRAPSDPAIRALVHVNAATGRLRLAYQDRLVQIYVRTAPLVRASPAEVRTERFGPRPGC